MPRLVIEVDVPADGVPALQAPLAAEMILDVYNEQQQQNLWPTATVVSARWED